MDTELSTFDGKRKYLTLEEQQRFLVATSQLDRAEVRTFCDTLAYTGCRISEALALTPERIDLSARAITCHDCSNVPRCHSPFKIPKLRCFGGYAFGFLRFSYVVD